MKIEIVASGSSGNCAIIDGFIAIDVGVPPTCAVEYVFLTHHHTDHTKHLDKVRNAQLFCLGETAEKLYAKNPYITPNRIVTGRVIHISGPSNAEYIILPIMVKHDAPCVGFDISKQIYGNEVERVLFATDFNSIIDETNVVCALREKRYYEVYIECNNTLCYDDFIDVYFLADGERPPKDEFHRRRSYENHCNVGYLISLFERAGYSEQNRFTEPVTLLHKSSFYYHQNIERIVDLCKIANVRNPFA